MKLKYIHREQSSNLILFYNGWGMDEGVLAHFNHYGFDVAMVYCYHQNHEIIDIDILSKYQSVNLIAWSMGVYFASDFINSYSQKITQSVAINGTPYPIDDRLGIPKSIFDGTIRNLDIMSLHKFQRRMFSSKIDFEFFKSQESFRNLEDQKEELSYIAKYYTKAESIPIFDKVYIGQNDRIIPTENQNRCWAKHPCVLKNETAHFPFYQLNSWSVILRRYE